MAQVSFPLPVAYATVAFRHVKSPGGRADRFMSRSLPAVPQSGMAVARCEETDRVFPPPPGVGGLC